MESVVRLALDSAFPDPACFYRSLTIRRNRDCRRHRASHWYRHRKNIPSGYRIFFQIPGICFPPHASRLKCLVMQVPLLITRSSFCFFKIINFDQYCKGKFWYRKNQNEKIRCNFEKSSKSGIRPISKQIHYDWGGNTKYFNTRNREYVLDSESS